MSSALAENKFMKLIPKTLSNQLNLIKKDKEIDEQKIQKMQQEDCTLASDRILLIQQKRRDVSPKRNQKQSDDEDNDKWQKLPPKQKQIKKISLSSVRDSSQKWQKNPEVVPVVAKPKKKITIQRDENGKAYFEEEIIEPANFQGNSNRSNFTHQQNQHSYHENRIEQEYDSLDDSYENKHNEENINRQYSSNSNGGRRLNIKKNISKYGYIQADNLPKQIDNEFLKDLLKKEKDNIVESYRQDNFGRVKFNSKEAAERAITILNKRVLYGSQINSYEINSDDYEKQGQHSNNNEDRSQLSNRIQSKHRK
ncbi:hypothetical protein ABPG72_011472 [Tetrahymena utriculariae]